MDSTFCQNDLRIWRDSEDGSLKFMILQKGKGCVKHPHPATKEEVFFFMMPYIYELAYFEAYGKPYSSDYSKAIMLKRNLEEWLQTRIGYCEMTISEARLILSELYLPTSALSTL